MCSLDELSRDNLGTCIESIGVWFIGNIFLVSLIFSGILIPILVCRLSKKTNELAAHQAIAVLGASAGLIFATTLLLPLAARALWVPAESLTLVLPSCIQELSWSCSNDANDLVAFYIENTSRKVIHVTPPLFFAVLVGFALSLLAFVKAIKTAWQ